MFSCAFLLKFFSWRPLILISTLMANAMKKQIYVLIILLLSLSRAGFAGCDITQFRWGCKINAEVTPKHQNSQLIYCGATRIYISKPQFEVLQRYQRAGVHMHLLVNNVFYDGPCVPENHKIHHQRTNNF
jgi:hypothetical protein